MAGLFLASAVVCRSDRRVSLVGYLRGLLQVGAEVVAEVDTQVTALVGAAVFCMTQSFLVIRQMRLHMKTLLKSDFSFHH